MYALTLSSSWRRRSSEPSQGRSSYIERITVPSRRATTRSTLSLSSITPQCSPEGPAANLVRCNPVPLHVRARRPGAVRAGPAQRDVVGGDVEAEPPPGALDQRLQ